MFPGVREHVRYPPMWRGNHCTYSAGKRMNRPCPVLGAPIDGLEWKLFRRYGVRWNRDDRSSRFTTQLSGADFASFPVCVSEFPGIVGCTVALPFGMRLSALAAGWSKGPIVSTWYQKTSAVEKGDRHFVSYTVELAHWPSRRTCIFQKHVTSPADRNFPAFETGGMGGRERGTYTRLFAVMRELFLQT